MNEQIIRKIVREALVREDAQSTREIIDLAQDVLIGISRQLAKILNKNFEKPAYDWNRPFVLPPIFLSQIPSFSKKTYNKLADFIENSNLEIWPKYKQEIKRQRGYYTPPGLYDNKPKLIIFYEHEYRHELMRSVKEKALNYLSMYPDTKPIELFNSHDFYFNMFIEFNKRKTLEHELQHAYDDYRSRGKVFQSKAVFKHGSKYGWGDDDLDTPGRYKSYLKLPHEVWARFVQAIGNIYFYSIDTHAQDKDGLKYTQKKMLDVRDVIEDFKSSFHGWKILPEKFQKRLIKSVVQYWYAEEKEVKHFNQVQRARAEFVQSKKEHEPELVDN